MLQRSEDRRVVCAVNVLFAPLRRAPVLTEDPRSLSIECRPFLVRKKLLVGILSGSLQGCLVVVAPDALQVRLAPRGLGRRVRLRRSPRRGSRLRGLACDRDRRQLQEHNQDHDHRRQTDQLETSSAHLMSPDTASFALLHVQAESKAQLATDLDQAAIYQPSANGTPHGLSPPWAVRVVDKQNGTVVQYVVDVEIRTQAHLGPD